MARQEKQTKELKMNNQANLELIESESRMRTQIITKNATGIGNEGTNNFQQRTQEVPAFLNPKSVSF